MRDTILQSVHNPVKSRVTPNRNVNEQIRARIVARMEARGWKATDYAKLGGLAGLDAGQVRKWLVGKAGGGTEKVPAEFIAALEEVGFASSRWMLTGRFPMDVQPDDAEVSAAARLTLVKILLEDDSDEVARRLLTWVEENEG